MDALLDRIARVHVPLFGHARFAFRFCGVIGLVFAVTQSVVLVSMRQLSFAMLLALACAAVMTFFILAIALKVTTGSENLIYYHHQFAVLAVSAVLLWILNRPVLPYLDIVALGIGAFLVSGRIGCLMAGCCHGRPHAHGIRYSADHVREGLLSCYSEVRLLPVQLVESLYVSAIVGAGNLLYLRSPVPGFAFVEYLSMYSAARFVLEFFRGDAERRHVWRLSEAQWTAIPTITAIGALQTLRYLPGFGFTFAAASIVLAAMIFSRLARPFSPVELRQIAESLRASRPAGALWQGPRGLRLSQSALGRDSDWRVVYTLSRSGKPLHPSVAGHIARLVIALRHPDIPVAELREGSKGVFHLLVSGN